MAVTLTLVSGDDFDSAVFAACYCGDLHLTFRFSRDLRCPSDTNSRIATFFHQIEAQDEYHSYQDGEHMREAIQELVSGIWRACASHPAIRFPDVIVQVRQDCGGNISWSISHESSFTQYLSSLWCTDTVQISVIGSTESKYPWASLDSLEFYHPLGGRGGVTLVHAGNERHVYKGLTFRLYLESSSTFRTERDTFYHELGLIVRLSEHSNFVQAPAALITTEMDGEDDGPSKKYVCGAIYPYMARRSLQDVIEIAEANDVRLSLKSKAKWAYQISSTMAKIHSLQQFHMDLKPSNVLLDEQENVILIDWEQLGASPFFLAPEASGKYDAALVSTHDVGHKEEAKMKLQYTEFAGQVPDACSAWSDRNVFKIWQNDCPPASEAAEVYSFGRTLWVIFEQVGEEMLVTERRSAMTNSIAWTSKSTDIPEAWKVFVNHSTCHDPNQRAKFSEAADFWHAQFSVLTQ